MQPIREWSRIEPDRLRHFHLRWIAATSESLDGGVRPPDDDALAASCALAWNVCPQPLKIAVLAAAS
jgi:hypothetical protein